MRVIISLDTEDFISPQAMDAQLWWIKALNKYGIRASFECVGEMVRKWRKEQCDDIIELIKGHEIGYHTRYHSLHPVHPEAVQDLSFAEALDWMHECEQPGLDVLQDVLGVNPVTYCPSGDSWTPATLLFMAMNGIKICACGPFYQNYCRPLWYGGLLAIHYNIGFETYYPREQPLNDFKADFKAECQRVGDDGVVVLYTHPTMLHSANFWDKPLKRGKIVKRENIQAAPMRSEYEIGRNYDFINQALSWLKGNPEVELVVHEDILSSIPQAERYGLDRLLAMHGLAPGEEAHLVDFDEQLNAEAFIPSEVTDNFTYGWSIQDPDLDMRQIRKTAGQLRWTSRKV